MLVGFVSDENYVALADVLLDFERDGIFIASVRSSARGAVYADLPFGDYRVTLQKPGFGSKRANHSIAQSHNRPINFRLLSDRLLGYMWPKWVRSGEKAEFRVHSAAPYHLSLWRYGIGKELVREIGWFDGHGHRAVMQITPDGDYSQTGVKWNELSFGSLHHTQFVAAPERSGLYYLHAKNEPGEFFSFPWIVAPARQTAKIAVLASTNTWNAYNAFGGRSNYANSAGLPPEPTVNARQDLIRYQGGAYEEWQYPDDAYLPLSFDRPEPLNHIREHVNATDPIAGRDACHTAPAEWRLLAWMEREGYEYDLYSESQLHEGLLDLDGYRILVLNAHPEYWSRRMYEHVKSWVFERGGRLIYLGGNGLDCEVEFIGESAIRCKTLHTPSSPSTLSTTSTTSPAPESRLARTVESQAGLLGVVCTEAGIMTSAPYQVKNAEHWAFDGTGLKNGETFGHKTLHERVPGGASGHETDKMSASSPPETVLLAKGLNPDEGGAEMVCLELASGGMVFSAGSITYAASLLVDEHVSKITRNVLERFLGPANY